MTFFDLVLRTSGSLHPDDFVSEFTGVIRCEDDTGTVWRVSPDLAARLAGLSALQSGRLWEEVRRRPGRDS